MGKECADGLDPFVLPEVRTASQPFFTAHSIESAVEVNQIDLDLGALWIADTLFDRGIFVAAVINSTFRETRVVGTERFGPAAGFPTNLRHNGTSYKECSGLDIAMPLVNAAQAVVRRATT